MKKKISYKKTWHKPKIQSLDFKKTYSGNTPGPDEIATYLPGES